MLNASIKVVKIMLFCVSVVLSLLACGGGGSGTDDLYADDPTVTPTPSPVASPTPSPLITPTPSPTPSPSPSPTPVTLSSLQTQIFTPTCSGCHSVGGIAAGTGLFLDSATNSFNNLVGVDSSLAANEVRVIASDPNNSYLVKKLEGAAGITGQRMPLGGTQLSTELIGLVRTWIGEGAVQDGAVTTSTKITGAKVFGELDDLSFSIALSGPIDPASLTYQSVQVYLVNGETKNVAPSEDVRLELTYSALIVTYTGDQEFDGLELQVNNQSFGTVTDMLGRQLDADNDGIQGGVFKHTYPVDF